jgi:hypothetical protein
MRLLSSFRPKAAMVVASLSKYVVVAMFVTFEKNI